MSRPAVTATATLLCSFGAAPASLLVLPTARVQVEGKFAATVVDATPLVNIPSFGMCTSPANPSVAAATAAALGVLTPMPCVPATTPWVNGATGTLVGGQPALTFGAQCQCAWGGVIQVLNPGSTTTIAG